MVGISTFLHWSVSSVCPLACCWYNHGTIWIFCALQVLSNYPHVQFVSWFYCYWPLCPIPLLLQWLWPPHPSLPISNTYHWLDSAIPIPGKLYLSEDLSNFLRHFCIYFNGLSDKVTCIRNINVFMSLSSVRSHSRL